MTELALSWEVIPSLHPACYYHRLKSTFLSRRKMYGLMES